MKNIFKQIDNFKKGNLEYKEINKLFQNLLDSGMIHSLQDDVYQRVAHELLVSGRIKMPQHRF